MTTRLTEAQKATNKARRAALPAERRIAWQKVMETYPGVVRPLPELLAAWKFSPDTGWHVQSIVWETCQPANYDDVSDYRRIMFWNQRAQIGFDFFVIDAGRNGWLALETMAEVEAQAAAFARLQAVSMRTGVNFDTTSFRERVAASRLIDEALAIS